MPRPQFITCQLCGKGFGSASINIHIPQCYEKAIKRWKLDPVGPRPVMPALHGAAKKSGSGANMRTATMASGSVGFDDQPCGGGVSAVRSLQAGNAPPPMMDGGGATANLNLHPCAKCGRSFNYDRIAYHESVCKGDQKRRVFDSSKQRRASGEGEDGYGSGFGRSSVGGRGGKKKGQLGVATTAGSSRYTPAPAPQTNWRQQHAEFINAIRSAKRADAESQNMWGTSAVAGSTRAPVAPSRGPQHAPFNRATNAGAASTRGMPAPSQRVPPLMTKQSESRQRNIATGGRAAQAKASAPMGAPPPRGGVGRPGNRPQPPSQSRNSFGGGGDRFGGRGYGMGGGGGGGGGRILNDNTTSVGMLQALGQA